ncbi:probable ubiquitin fusion degradation protein 2 [Rhynchosporium graminicola]|uniref:Probable ubiquitin fusion degradation protein 2 n=1 Tax=Rhynchosporium graminicola TaxID=2792576 RepID=A0A1E1L9J7_9HELO|nr:probable ubiquitin fusion degradation protein 2 [Rhynchosporium commune]
MDNDPPPPPLNVSNLPDAPDKEKMDQIRRKRMEKLSSATPRSKAEGAGEMMETDSLSTLETGSTPATEPTQATPKKIQISKAAPSSNPTDPNPFTKLGAQARAATMPTTVSIPDATSSDLKRKRTEPSAQTSSPTLPRTSNIPAADEPIEQWENRTLSSIFRITLDHEQRTDGTHKLIFLPNLRQELIDEEVPVLLAKERLDSALLEAASTIPNHKSILDYLLPCWKRVTKVLKGRRGYAGEKDAVLKEAKRLCMSYCIFAVDMPELFGRSPNPSTDSLTPYLLFEGGEEMGVCPDFLTELVSRLEEDETVKTMIIKAVSGISLALSNMTMNDNYKPHVEALKALCQFKPIATAIALDPFFQIPTSMATSAPAIEKFTILGPFFRISPLQSEVTKEYFAAPKTMDKRFILNSQEALRLTLQSHQKDLLDIVNQLVRASPESKNQTLQWFAHVVNSNHKRRAMRPDATLLSTDGFLMNVTVVLDGLCEPFMDTMFSKVDRIDVDYLRRKPRVDIKEETKLNADQEASDGYYDVEVSGSSNFISEVFFLTLAAHHYGSEATNGMLKSLDKDIKTLTSKVAELEAERPKFTNSPMNMARFEEQLKRFNDVLEKSMSLKFAIEGVLLDKVMQAKSLMFMRVVTVWLLRIATGSNYTPDQTIQLPLPAEQPDAFKYLPEYVLEDIVGNFNFVFRYMPDVMISAVGDELIALCITFLTNSDYIKNPYLKAKLVTLLFHGTWPVYHRTKGVLGDSLIGMKFANDHLLHALMKFYIEVESTGMHTQFYDKFNIRYEIFQVIKCIWTNDVYKQRLTQESRTNIQFFLKFVNLLLNDATYVLDEALTKFPKIHDLQQELRDPHATFTPDQRTAKEEELASAETQAQSYMQLTNETVSMMKLFTKTLSASFTMPEIVDRVAAMLNFTLDTLVGPKSANLKVEDPKKYAFEPKTLLCEFFDVYLNLSVSENFIVAVARDGRSYKPENFDAATRIITRYSLRAGEEVASFETLKDRFKIAKMNDDQEDLDMGEPPDEFMDPLMATLMTDPVMLPISRQIVDRSTIRSHLLSEPHDPYNRAPLKIEDVIPQPELLKQIEEWVKETKEKARAARLQAKTDAAMEDTEEKTAMDVSGQ